MRNLLKEFNAAVDDVGSYLSQTGSDTFRKRYQDLAKKECPQRDERKKGTREKINLTSITI